MGVVTVYGEVTDSLSALIPDVTTRILTLVALCLGRKEVVLIEMFRRTSHLVYFVGLNRPVSILGTFL